MKSDIKRCEGIIDRAKPYARVVTHKRAWAYVCPRCGKERRYRDNWGEVPPTGTMTCDLPREAKP